jgi:dienelactone hydrolase
VHDSRPLFAAPAQRRTPAVALLVAWWLVACTASSPLALYPASRPPAVTSHAEVVDVGDLRMTFYWSVPGASAPAPAVLLHPGIEEDAHDLRGMTWDLAQRGYAAVAVDYERRANGYYQHVTLPLRTSDEFTAALRHVRRQPAVDGGRIAVLGFSLGGTYALLAAAQDNDVRAAVAYYPITDFPAWVRWRERSWVWRWIILAARGSFTAESLENNDAVHLQLLERTSVLAVAEKIRAPTLLIHGERDDIAPVSESVALAARLREHDTRTRLEIVPGAGHSFNFIDPPAAEATWALTLDWLAQHLGH